MKIWPPLFPELWYYERRPLIAELIELKIKRDDTERRSKLEAEELGRRLLKEMPKRRLTVPGSRMAGSGRAEAG